MGMHYPHRMLLLLTALYSPHNQTRGPLKKHPWRRRHKRLSTHPRCMWTPSHILVHTRLKVEPSRISHSNPLSCKQPSSCLHIVSLRLFQSQPKLSTLSRWQHVHIQPIQPPQPFSKLLHQIQVPFHFK